MSAVRLDDLSWVDALLERWAAWRAGGLSLGLGASLCMNYEPRLDDDAQVPFGDPTFDRQMMDVDRAVGGLTPPLRAVVEAEYDHGANLTQRDRAGRCRCGVDAYRRRLILAHELVAFELRGKAELR